MKRVMVIEDDVVVAGIYRNKLQNDGFKVEIITDGETAIRQLKIKVPDLVILDLGLPKVNGIEVLKAIRSNPLTTALPVLVLSNSYVTSMVDAAWQEGANRCLAKGSCTPRQLSEIIEELFASVAKKAAAAPASGSGSGSGSAAAVPQGGQSESNDLLFQTQVRNAFVGKLPTFSAEMRKHLQAFARGGTGDAATLASLFEFYRLIQSLATNAGLAGFARIGQLSSAFEAFLKELHEKPRNIGPSPVRTAANAVDALIGLFNEAATVVPETPLAPLVLVLDDDAISRKTICLALEKAQLRAVSTDDPNLALKLLEDNSFELILSDVEMPEMNGYTFCKKARALSRHKTTPVIFVTSHSDFENRAHSKLSGGTDLIGKPFLLLEVAVKALTALLKAKPAAPAEEPAAVPPESAAPPPPSAEAAGASPMQQLFRKIRPARGS